MRLDMLARLRELSGQGKPAVVVTRLRDGAQALVHDHAVEGDLALGPEIIEQARARVRTDLSGSLDGDLFVRVYNPPLRLLIVGAVHIAQALASIAETAGFQAVVIDPRTAYATGERFASARLVAEWPDQALEKLAPDSRTAVVTLTHDPKLDEPALVRALQSGAFYIGSLGSRKTHAARLARLRAAGVAEVSLARIHAPVGLPLGGRRPAEIAVSIMAEIIQELHREQVAENPN